MISETLVELSRWQFALTALFHFVFLPLNLGLGLLVACLESAYVLSGKPTYLAACRFWGEFWQLNFVLSVLSLLLLLLQIGSQAAYFAHYAGDVFALPWAVEILTVLVSAILLFGPYHNGWERLSRRQHLSITWLLTLSISFSAFTLFMSNAWLQNPLGMAFNSHAYRLELTDYSLLLHNPILFSKALHGFAASYVTAALTIMALSASLLLQNPQHVFARSSFKLAACLGLVSSLLLCTGDTTPQLTTPTQAIKLAALANSAPQTASAQLESHIRKGIQAYTLLEQLRDEKTDPQLVSDFEALQADLGYGLLLKRHSEAISDASEAQIAQALQEAHPASASRLYWAKVIMLPVGYLVIAWFVLALLLARANQTLAHLFLTLTQYLAALSWLASIVGWYIAEAGIQPWAIAGALPSFLAPSSLTVTEAVIYLSTSVIIMLALLGIAGFLGRKLLIANHTQLQGAQA